MVMTSSGSDIVQVELNERRVMDTGVRSGNTQMWSRLAFDQSKWWAAEGKVKGHLMREGGCV